MQQRRPVKYLNEQILLRATIHINERTEKQSNKLDNLLHELKMLTNNIQDMDIKSHKS
jgi:hypothetical protein